MLFNALRTEDFFGRRDDLAHLRSLAEDAEKGVVRNLLLCGPPGVGKTALLRQLAFSLFRERDKTAPFLYAANPAVSSVSDFSRDYLTSFLCQRIGFETGDAETASLSGISLEAVESIARAARAPWAVDILERFRGCMDSPIDSMHCALSAPHASVMHTGRPVVAMLDGFENLSRLRRGDGPARELVDIFDETFNSPLAVHIITGNETDLIELPVLKGLARLHLAGLAPSGSEEMFISMTEKRGVSLQSVPASFLSRLGGRPYALRSCALSIEPEVKAEEKDLWSVYVREVLDGGIAGYWLARFKRCFPDLNPRRAALEIAYMIQHSEHPVALAGVPRTISISRERVEPIVAELYRAGFVRAEFGVVSAPDDPVLHDVVEGLYQREVLGKSVIDVEMHLLETLMPSSAPLVTYEIILPATKEAELVAVKCIEQIGQNHRLDGQTIGRLQMALVEACIHAVEQKNRLDGKIFIKAELLADRMEVSVESAAKHFILREKAEGEIDEIIAAERDQSIRLMKQFVDDVRIEGTARGSRIVLVKTLKRLHENQMS